MLKFKYNSKEDIPEGAESYYEEKDGVFYLQIEGAVSKDKVTEFRDKNIKLTKELDGLKEKFDGIDPDEAKRLKSKQKEIDEYEVTKDQKLEEAVETRVKTMRDDHQKELDKANNENQIIRNKLTIATVDSKILEAGSKHGIKTDATDDLLNRMRATFSLNDEGEIVAKDSNGDPLYGKTGEGLTIDEAVQNLAKSAKHLFEESSGASSGQGSKGGHTGDNPWKTNNLTEQARIYRESPQKAERLAKEAGKKLQVATS